MIKKFLAIALAVLTLAACAPEYGFEDIPLVIEELVTSGEGNLLSRADGKETQHTYSFDVTENEVKITATLSKSDDVLIKHIKDTLRAGANLNDALATKTLVYEASDNIERLIEFGVEFDTDNQGNLLMAQEGGHGTRRIL